MAIQNAQVVRFATFEVDLRSGELRKGGLKLKLGGQPFQVLAILLERPGEVVTREELQKRLWPDTFVDVDHNLNTAINKIREALGDSAENSRFVETLARRGYRFIGAVNGAEQARVAEAKPTRRSRSLILPAAVGLVGIVGITAVLFALNVHGWRDRLFVHAARPRIQALAVIHFANLSGDPEQEYFADGMTEEIITKLGEVNAPRVISRQSMMQYKGSKKPLQEIARELNVDAVLEGAVERSGSRVRVRIHLDQVSPESQLWAKQYDRDIHDVLQVQDEIARTVADEIRVKLTPEGRTRLTTAHNVSPEAHDNYLRGQFFLYRDLEEVKYEQAIKRNLQTAIGYFRQAIEKDPDYAAAYVGLAETYIGLGTEYRGGDYPKDVMPQAKAAAEKALQLDPSLGRAHFSLAQVLELYDWNWSEADKEYRLALKLDPNYAFAHLQYGRYLQALGRNDEAIRHVNYALELDPFDFKTKDLAAFVTWATRVRPRH